MACPRKMESIRLYAAFTNMPRIAGMANSVMSRGRDAVPMRATRSSPCDLRAGALGEEGVPTEASGVDFKDWPRCSSCAVICIPHASIVSFAIFRKQTIVCISAHKKEQFITPTARKRRQAEGEMGRLRTRSRPRMLRRSPWATHNAACTVALELAKADAPRPRRRLSPRRLPVGGSAAHRLRAPYPRKRLLPAD